jgi:hypothetical protein
MKAEERHEYAKKILALVIESTPSGPSQFSILMTAITIFLASQDEAYDAALDGFENELKRLVKTARKSFKEIK